MLMIGSTRAWMVRSAKSMIVLYETVGEADRAPPAIELWYGQHMMVGHRGTTQRWLNILGRVTDSQSKIVSLSYRLNDSEVEIPLSIGPDERRLIGEGDFNIDIAKGLYIAVF